MSRKVAFHLRQNVVAYVALFFALGGTGAYAANEWNSANIQNNTLESRDLKDNAGVRSADVVDDTATGGGLRGRDILNDGLTSSDVRDLTGADVTDESLTGSDVDDGSIGQDDLAAGVGEGGPRAIARVDASGTLDQSASRNVTNAKKAATGQYCLDLPFASKNVVASVEGFITPEPDLVIHPHAGTTVPCAGLEWDVFVSIYDAAGPSPGYEDAAFYAWIE